LHRDVSVVWSEGFCPAPDLVNLPGILWDVHISEEKMNIYVGNLPFSATEDALRQAFEAYGKVTSAAIIKDKFSGESRGFGFVEMPNAAEAQAAIGAMNGKDFGGRNLAVNEARPRDDSGKRGMDRRPGGGGGDRRERRPGGGGGRRSF
jgi:cold-inducible RNA-binding protein